METGGKTATHGLLPEVLHLDGFTGNSPALLKGRDYAINCFRGLKRKIAIPRYPAIEPFTLWLLHPHPPRNLFIVLCLS